MHTLTQWLTLEGITVFVLGLVSGILLTMFGVMIALQCLVWRGM